MYSGKRMILIRGSFMSLDRGKTYYVCDHHQVNVVELPRMPAAKL